MRQKEPTPDCRTCGACCVSLYDQEVFCDVTPDDQERLGKRFVRLHVLQEPYVHHGAAIKTKWRTQRAGPLRGIDACACVALRGSVMHRVSCRVYENRPHVCRTALRPGDRACRDLRRLYREAIDELPTT